MDRYKMEAGCVDNELALISAVEPVDSAAFVVVSLLWTKERTAYPLDFPVVLSIGFIAS